MTAGSRKAVVVVGAGNVGSQLVPLIGRLPELARVTVIDRDTYDGGNLASQAILPRDVGLPKARVMAAWLRELRPSLEADAIVAPVEGVPWGMLRADLVLGCLDSREARRVMAETAWRLGVPLLDAGVHGAGLLARVAAWDPRVPGGPCLQCGWGEADYRALEQRYPCAGADGGRASQAPPTGAPAALGALAASLLALECGKWLGGREDRLASGHEVLIDAASHTHYRTRVRRRAACRFDHATWRIARLEGGPAAVTLAEALGLTGSRGGATLGAAGLRFATRLACAACGPEPGRPLPRLVASLSEQERACGRCGGARTPTGFDLTERLDPALLPEGALRLPLRAFGLRPREVFSIEQPNGAAHFELGAEHDAAGGA